MKVQDLGGMDYQVAWDIQKAVAEDVANGGEEALLLVEHPPVLTLGASFHESNLLLPLEDYARKGVQVIKTDRGGDVTYHGPGQLVAYPIFDIKHYGQDLHYWLRTLEDVVIKAIGQINVEGERLEPHTGVWVRSSGIMLKVAAIGIKVKKWVNLHGIALNCDLNLDPFRDIVPCGIQAYGVTSLTEVLGRNVCVEEAKVLLTLEFEELSNNALRMSERV